MFDQERLIVQRLVSEMVNAEVETLAREMEHNQYWPPLNKGGAYLLAWGQDDNVHSVFDTLALRTDFPIALIVFEEGQ